MNDLMFRIKKHYSELTPSSRKIADYLQASGSDAQYFSISELAQACRVAEATVFRFCRSLGFGGYNEFKLALAKSLVRTEPTRQDAPISAAGAGTDAVQLLAHRLYSSQLNAMDDALAHLSSAAVSHAVSLFENAQKVYCFGNGCSMVSAMEAWSRFSCISGKFFTVQDSHSQLMAASLLNKDDVVLYISISGTSREAADLLRTAKSRGAKVVLLTCSVTSISSTLADVLLLCGSPETSSPVVNASSRVGVLFEIEILVNEFYRRNQDSVLKNRDLTRSALSCRHKQ